jgi:hypothetical protein
MGKMCTTNDMFNYLLNETDLIKTSLEKDHDDCFNHSVDKFEEFMHFCKEPEYLFRILTYVTPPKYGLKKRIYYEILKVIEELTDNIDIKVIENSLYKGEIFDKILDTLKLDTYLGDYLGIWNLLLNDENEKIVEIFSRNTYNIGDIFINQVDNLITNKLTEMRLYAVIKIMNLFLKIGEKVKSKYNKKKDYIEQLRKVYEKIKIISSQSSQEEGENKYFSEIIDEFNKYFDK